MGYRSTFTTLDHDYTLPEWFTEKYEWGVTNPTGTLLCPTKESKIYTDSEFLNDYQSALSEAGFFDTYDSEIPQQMFVCVMSEDGYVTKYIIESKSIMGYAMIEQSEIYFWDAK